MSYHQENEEDIEDSGLLPGSDLDDGLARQETDTLLAGHVTNLYRNFVTMSIAFSFNHGCVVSCLAYATAELGNDLGGYGSGALYVCYALTAFLLSKPVVTMIGPKRGLLAGVSGYCVYVAGFLFAVVSSSASWPIFITACTIGGIAGGLLWTSQGRYFARNAKLYSEHTGIPVEHVNATFAGVFATSYLGLEMVTKVLATVLFLIFPDGAEYIVFTTYAAIAVSSSFVIASLSDLEENGTWDFSTKTIVSNVGAAGRLVIEDVRLALLLPFQIAFGFASSFVPYYVFGTIIANNLGTTWVGLLSAIIVLTGALIAIPSSWLANKVGKPLVMSIGGISLSLSGLLLFMFSDAEIGTWALIVPYLVIYGMGRGTWENTNKAVIADFFTETPDLSTAAFAAVSFSNGLAGSIGYFSFGDMTRSAMAGLVLSTSVVAVACYLLAAYIHEENKNVVVQSMGKYSNI